MERCVRSILKFWYQIRGRRFCGILRTLRTADINRFQLWVKENVELIEAHRDIIGPLNVCDPKSSGNSEVTVLHVEEFDTTFTWLTEHFGFALSDHIAGEHAEVGMHRTTITCQDKHAV